MDALGAKKKKKQKKSKETGRHSVLSGTIFGRFLTIFDVRVDDVKGMEEVNDL